MSGPVETSQTTAGQDVRAIVALHADVYAGYKLGHRFLPTVEAQLAEIAEGKKPGIIWVTTAGERLLGSIALSFHAHGGRVRYFAVAKTARRAGVGGRLLDGLLEEARDRQLARLELSTFSEPEAAAALYRRAGFTIFDERLAAPWGGRTVLEQRYVLELA